MSMVAPGTFKEAMFSAGIRVFSWLEQLAKGTIKNVAKSKPMRTQVRAVAEEIRYKITWPGLTLSLT
jgi:hypothetical protein